MVTSIIVAAYVVIVASYIRTFSSDFERETIVESFLFVFLASCVIWGLLNVETVIESIKSVLNKQII